MLFKIPKFNLEAFDFCTLHWQLLLFLFSYSGLLKEVEFLSKEKLELQCQAEKDHSNLRSQMKVLEVELEEQLHSNQDLATQLLEVAELKQQIEVLEKQLKNQRQFMDVSKRPHFHGFGGDKFSSWFETWKAVPKMGYFQFWLKLRLWYSSLIKEKKS